MTWLGKFGVEKGQAPLVEFSVPFILDNKNDLVHEIINQIPESKIVLYPPKVYN